MLTIACGEDSTVSRQYVLDLKKDYQQKQYETLNIHAKDIIEAVTKSDLTSSLFSQKIIYFTENLNTYLSRIKNKELIGQFEQISTDKTVEVVDWEEDKSARDLKIAKLGRVKEFKPASNVFQLLDACTPKNRLKFLTLLESVTKTQDSLFVFTMLSRHARTLLLAKTGSFGTRVQPWQRGKLSSQAKQWDEEKLEGFYRGLFKIDTALKTGATPFDLKKSLDILACYYL